MKLHYHISLIGLIRCMVNVDYMFETRRQDDLIVVDTFEVNQAENNEVTWRIAPLLHPD